MVTFVYIRLSALAIDLTDVYRNPREPLRTTKRAPLYNIMW